MWAIPATCLLPSGGGTADQERRIREPISSDFWARISAKGTAVVCYDLKPTPASSQDPSGFIGGTQLLPAGSDWPSCRICHDKLVHFLDIELPEESRPFKPGSRLQIFACREHDDIPGTTHSNHEPFRQTNKRYWRAASLKQLPKNYWKITDGHYVVRLLPPGTATVSTGNETRIVLRNLRQVRRIEVAKKPKKSLKLFGYPRWVQYPEKHLCCCSAPMRLLLQIPENFAFEMTSGSPEQPKSFSSRQYCLFLGNNLYLFGCTRQCNPLALWPVVQH